MVVAGMDRLLGAPPEPPGSPQGSLSHFITGEQTLFGFLSKSLFGSQQAELSGQMKIL